MARVKELKGHTARILALATSPAEMRARLAWRDDASGVRRWWRALRNRKLLGKWALIVVAGSPLARQLSLPVAADGRPLDRQRPRGEVRADRGERAREVFLARGGVGGDQVERRAADGEHLRVCGRTRGL